MGREVDKDELSGDVDDRGRIIVDKRASYIREAVDGKHASGTGCEASPSAI